MGIVYAATVQYKNTFLILGGKQRDEEGKYLGLLDTVIRYNENGEWETLPIRLAVARHSHVAIPKPAC